MLEVNSVFKSYGKNEILNDVSLRINRQEAVSLTGESGCGKSTLAGIICGTVKPNSGSALFNGEKLFDDNGYLRNPKIQLIPQQPMLFLDPKQRIFDALAEPLKVHKKTKGKAETEKRVKELLESVWLEEGILKRYPSQISGGQAQRVLIARALALEPSLIIADEACAMLDTISTAQIICILRNLIKEKEMSVLLISHDMELVKSFSQRNYHLEGKELSEQIFERNSNI